MNKCLLNTSYVPGSDPEDSEMVAALNEFSFDVETIKSMITQWERVI